MNNIRFLKSKYFEYLILSIIIILGFAVRLYKIQSPIADWHSWRQADTASVSRIYTTEGISLLLPRYHDISSVQSRIFNPNGYRMVEFPFYNALNAILATNIRSISLEVWARLITIACALITSFFLYLIGKRFIGKWGGLLAQFFYLFVPYNIYFTRVILPDPMGVMFGIISLWFFIKFFDDGGDFFLYSSAIFFSLMMLIKPYFGFYLLPIGYLAIQKFTLKKILITKKLWIKGVVFMAIALLPFFIWRTWEARFSEGIPLYLWAFNGDRIRFKPSFWYWIFGERLGHLILGSLGLIPFTFGVFYAKGKNLFIQWFLMGILLYIVVIASANVMHDYYQIMVMPAIALALASGSAYLWSQQTFNKWLVRISLAVSIVVMFITGWNQIVGNYNINHPEIIEAGREIDRVTPKDALVIAPYIGDTSFLYQTNRKGWPVIDDSIDNMIKHGADYYVTVDLGSADAKMLTARFATLEKTDKFIIIDLNKPLSTKQQ